MDPFCSISAEVWAHIVRYLQFDDLLQCELSSKRLRMLTQTAWSSDQFTSFLMARPVEQDLFVVFQTVDLICRLRCFIDRVGSDRLQEISLTAPNVGPRGESTSITTEVMINEIARLAPRLKRLRFQNSDLTAEAIEAIGQLVDLDSLSLIGSWSPLSSFILDAPWQVRENAVETELHFEIGVNQALQRLHQLKTFRLVDFPPGRQLVPQSSLFTRAIRSPELQTFDICAKHVDLNDLADFIQSHPQIIDFSVRLLQQGTVRVLASDSPSIIRLLVNSCPNLRNLHIYCLGVDAIQDFALLHDLESLELIPGGFFGSTFNDDEVIEMCRRNRRLENFIFESHLVTERAYAEGFSLLTRLRVLKAESSAQLTDRTLEGLVEAMSLSLRELTVYEQRLLTVESLRVLGLSCVRIEKLDIYAWNGDVPWCSAAAMCAFAQAIASSGKRRGKVIVSFCGTYAKTVDFTLPSEAQSTGLVSVCVNDKRFSY